MRRDKRKISKNRTGFQGQNSAVENEEQILDKINESANSEDNLQHDKPCKQVKVRDSVGTKLKLDKSQQQNNDELIAPESVSTNSEFSNPIRNLESANSKLKSSQRIDNNLDTTENKLELDIKETGDVAKGQFESTSDDLHTSTPDVASRFYSSLNLLATRAFFNVKLEPVEVSVAEKCGQDYLSSLKHKQETKNFVDECNATSNNESGSPVSKEDLSCLPPHAEVSLQTFAEQLRHNDSASMVVRRPLAAKMSNPGPESLNTGGGRTNGSSLHHFVTRYTVEKPDDSSRLGLDICLESNDLNEAILEVECGGNKGLLYVTKLCQGSKGQSILFNDEWLTPNEFQFISGRETAKDWKRSIRHCGKSLKTLMTKGVLQVHPPVCECDYCKGLSTAKSENAKPNSTMQHDTSLCVDDTSVKPLSLVFSDASTSSSSKQGREGGLNSIISQLHNKKANTRCEASSPNGVESIDMRVNSTGNGSSNRKRRTDSDYNEYPSDEDGVQSISSPKKCYSDVEDNCRNQQYGRKSQESQHRTHSIPFWTNKKSSNNLSPWLDVGENGHKSLPRPGFGYSEYALYDAMKRAVANGYCTPPPSMPLPSLPNCRSEVKKQPMVELTSPRTKNFDKKNLYAHWDYRKPFNEQLASFDGILPFHEGSFLNRIDPCTNSSLQNNLDPNNMWFGSYPNAFQAEHQFENNGRRNRFKSDKKAKSAKLLAPLSHKNRPRTTNKQSNQPKMVNLHNHAIPMTSLTYKNSYGERMHQSDYVLRSCKRNTDSSPPALSSNSSYTANDPHHETAHLKSNDVLRRLSSSAPPSQAHMLQRKTTSPLSKHQANDFEFHNGTKSNNSVPISSGFSPTSSTSLFGDLPVEMRNSELLLRKELTTALEEMGEWSVDAVGTFLEEIGCQQYKQVFRENEINGDALPLLVERHLVEKMGLKLGHALKLIARVHRRIGTHLSLITNHHCSAKFAHCFCGMHAPHEISQIVTTKSRGDSAS